MGTPIILKFQFDRQLRRISFPDARNINYYEIAYLIQDLFGITDPLTLLYLNRKGKLKSINNQYGLERAVLDATLYSQRVQSSDGKIRMKIVVLSFPALIDNQESILTTATSEVGQVGTESSDRIQLVEATAAGEGSSEGTSRKDLTVDGKDGVTGSVVVSRSRGGASTSIPASAAGLVITGSNSSLSLDDVTLPVKKDKLVRVFESSKGPHVHHTAIDESNCLYCHHLNHHLEHHVNAAMDTKSVSASNGAVSLPDTREILAVLQHQLASLNQGVGDISRAMRYFLSLPDETDAQSRFWYPEPTELPPHDPEAVIVLCSLCRSVIFGGRWICSECSDYSLCSKCAQKQHDHPHPLHVLSEGDSALSSLSSVLGLEKPPYVTQPGMPNSLVSAIKQNSSTAAKGERSVRVLSPGFDDVVVVPRLEDIMSDRQSATNVPVISDAHGSGVASQVVHHNVFCGNCRREIRGVRYRCANCNDFSLCSACEAYEVHDPDHIFLKLKKPLDPLLQSSDSVSSLLSSNKSTDPADPAAYPSVMVSQGLAGIGSDMLDRPLSLPPTSHLGASSAAVLSSGSLVTGDSTAVPTQRPSPRDSPTKIAPVHPGPSKPTHAQNSAEVRHVPIGSEMPAPPFTHGGPGQHMNPPSPIPLEERSGIVPPPFPPPPVPPLTSVPPLGYSEDISFPYFQARCVGLPDGLDGYQFAPGARIQKTWLVRNVGQHPWPESTQVRLVGSSSNTLMDQGFPFVFSVGAAAPGQTVPVKVKFRVPQEPGAYSTYWRLTTSDGQRFGDTLTWLVRVKGLQRSTSPPSLGEWGSADPYHGRPALSRQRPHPPASFSSRRDYPHLWPYMSVPALPPPVHGPPPGHWLRSGPPIGWEVPPSDPGFLGPGASSVLSASNGSGLPPPIPILRPHLRSLLTPPRHQPPWGATPLSPPSLSHARGNALALDFPGPHSLPLEGPRSFDDTLPFLRTLARPPTRQEPVLAGSNALPPWTTSHVNSNASYQLPPSRPSMAAPHRDGPDLTEESGTPSQVSIPAATGVFMPSSSDETSALALRSSLSHVGSPPPLPPLPQIPLPPLPMASVPPESASYSSHNSDLPPPPLPPLPVPEVQPNSSRHSTVALPADQSGLAPTLAAGEEIPLPSRPPPAGSFMVPSTDTATSDRPPLPPLPLSAQHTSFLSKGSQVGPTGPLEESSLVSSMSMPQPPPPLPPLPQFSKRSSQISPPDPIMAMPMPTVSPSQLAPPGIPSHMKSSSSIANPLIPSPSRDSLFSDLSDEMLNSELSNWRSPLTSGYGSQISTPPSSTPSR
ncbi:hypothetical protein IWQ62_000458, partial [Dispira parvispora]